MADQQVDFQKPEKNQSIIFSRAHCAHTKYEPEVRCFTFFISDENTNFHR